MNYSIHQKYNSTFKVEFFIVLFIIYFSFFIDTTNALFKRATGEYPIFSLVNRFVAEIIFIILLMKNKIHKQLFVILFFIIINSFGIIISLFSVDMRLIDIGTNFVIVNKTLYVFIILPIIFYYFNENREYIFNFFKIAYFVFASSIIIGVLFNSPLLQSYNQGIRFGSKGVIVTTGQAVGIMVIGLLFFIAEFDATRKIKNIIFTLLIFISGMLTGSKSSLLILPVSFLFIFFHNFLNSKKFTKFVLLILPFIYLINWSNIFKIYNSTISYLNHFYQKGHSLIYIISSGRNLRVEHLFNKIFQDDYSLYNFLFGGFNFNQLGTEMDFFDLFQLFGVIGLILFYYIYFKTLIRFSLKYKYIYFFIIIWLIASTFGGHMIYNAVIPIYLSILILKFHEVQQIKKNEFKYLCLR